GERRGRGTVRYPDNGHPGQVHRRRARRRHRKTRGQHSRAEPRVTSSVMNPTELHTTLKLTRRMRRLRKSDAMRALVRETRLSPEMFMLPLFVCEGRGVRREVSSMPGVFNLSVDEAVKEVEAARGEGIRSVLLFGLPDHKDGVGSASYDPNAPVQSAVRAIKSASPDVLVATDVCLCEYTDHGHCGVIVDNEVSNDPTVEQLVRAAVSPAAAGADLVAPSDLMDGRV